MVDSGPAAVVLFCGDPRRDEGQKRLPPGFLAAIHRSLRQTVSSIAEADVLTVATRGRRMVMTGAVGTAECAEESLAQRINFAIRFCFDSGYGRVVIIGGDVPLLTRDLVVETLNDLRATKPTVVLGPCGDGGFYLAGFNRPPRFDWQRVLDRRESAWERLASQAVAAQVELQLLPPIDDVDDATDAWRLTAAGAIATRTRRLIDLLISLLLAVPAAPLALHAIAASCSHRVDAVRGPPLLVS